MAAPVHPLRPVAVALTLAPNAVRADQELIDYRNAVMGSIGGHTTALVAIVKGNVPYTQDAPVHARAIEPLSKMAEHIFPPTLKTGKTDALPAIWSSRRSSSRRWRHSRRRRRIWRKLPTASQAISPLRSARWPKACKSCHDDFRKKDEGGRPPAPAPAVTASACDHQPDGAGRHRQDHRCDPAASVGSIRTSPSISAVAALRPVNIGLIRLFFRKIRYPNTAARCRPMRT